MGDSRPARSAGTNADAKMVSSASTTVAISPSGDRYRPRVIPEAPAIPPSASTNRLLSTRNSTCMPTRPKIIPSGMLIRPISSPSKYTMRRRCLPVAPTELSMPICLVRSDTLTAKAL